MEKQVSDIRRTLLCIIAIAMGLNLLLVAYVTTQYGALKRVEAMVVEQTPQHFDMARKLTEIESSIGYLGFIHHFKNYVLRRDDSYYHAAIASYEQSHQLLSELAKMQTNNDLSTEIQILSNTLNEYKAKLDLARSLPYTLTSAEVDEVVAVNDIAAATALKSMQDSLEPHLEKSAVEAEKDVYQSIRYTLAFNMLMIPIILGASLYIFKTSRRSYRLAHELNAIFDVSPDGMLYIEDNGQILYANKKACQLFQYSFEELTQRKVEDLVSPELREKHKQYRIDFMNKAKHRRMEQHRSNIQGMSKTGKQLDLAVAIASGSDINHNRAVCIVRDLQPTLDLKQRAEKDHLTQLYNRSVMDDMLRKELQRSHRTGDPLSVFLIDLDNFKAVNDHKGHGVGDQVLRQTAQFLLNHTRAYDHVGRWGGDEFIVLCPNLTPTDGKQYAERLRDAFTQLEFSQHHDITLSIGIVTSDEQTHYNSKNLFTAADNALYRSKNEGKNRVYHIEDAAGWLAK